MKISELIFDDHNANKGTSRGRGMLEKSLSKYGAGRSILIDKNNRIIAGNKTAECAVEIQMNNVRVIETDGSEIIAVKRTDLDLITDHAARELAFADNRVAQVDLEWVPEKIAQAQIDGIDLSDFFSQNEIDGISLEENIDKTKESDDKNEYSIQVKVLYFRPEDWIEQKNKIVNFLFEHKIDYRIEE